MSNTYEKITQYGYAYLVPSISVFGILCNLINLSVLLNSRLKESPYTYLTGLATFDLLTLLFGLCITFTRSQQLWFSNISDLRREFILANLEKKFFIPTANLFSALSVTITVTLTIERYLFIKFPMHASTYCLPKYARKIIFLLFILVFLFRIPMYLFRDVKLVNLFNATISYHSNNQTNFTSESMYITLNDLENCIYNTNPNQSIVSWQIATLNRTILVNKCSNVKVITQSYHDKFQNIYFITSFFIFEIIPFFILLILNSNLILMVRKSNREAKKLRKISVVEQQQQQQQQPLITQQALPLEAVENVTTDSNSSASQHQPSVIIQRQLEQNQSIKPKQQPRFILPLFYRDTSYTSNNPYMIKTRSSTRMRSCKQSKREKDQMKLTRTLIAVIIVALFSEIMSIITYDKITKFLIGQKNSHYMNNGYQIQRLISNTVVLIAHSINFFLYCAFNKRYLIILHETYSLCMTKLRLKFLCLNKFRNNNGTNSDGINGNYLNGTNFAQNSIKHKANIQNINNLRSNLNNRHTVKYLNNIPIDNSIKCTRNRSQSLDEKFLKNKNLNNSHSNVNMLNRCRPNDIITHEIVEME